MNKKITQIDYAKIGSILKSKATQELEESVGKDLQKADPPKPLSIKELTDLQPSHGNGDKIDWSKPPAPSEAELRQQEADEIDALDNELNSE